MSDTSSSLLCPLPSLQFLHLHENANPQAIIAAKDIHHLPNTFVLFGADFPLHLFFLLLPALIRHPTSLFNQPLRNDERTRCSPFAIHLPAPFCTWYRGILAGVYDEGSGSPEQQEVLAPVPAMFDSAWSYDHPQQQIENSVYAQQGYMEYDSEYGGQDVEVGIISSGALRAHSIHPHTTRAYPGLEGQVTGAGNLPLLPNPFTLPHQLQAWMHLKMDPGPLPRADTSLFDLSFLSGFCSSEIYWAKFST
ncbi:hypothetical protein BDQ17DRAFT_1437558 [Cyathus striatus]|nr:hypothetical protein BDQ17DRAFT_1437558 [Cyathus striatus]